MKFFKYTLNEKEKQYCLHHANKMAEGFSTYSFKNNTTQSVDVYYIGKVGEFVFYKFLRELEKEEKLKIKHVPFRENYNKVNYKDDFIIEIDGNDYQIEVRTKGRNVDPKPYYECCTDCIKPHFTYVFLSLNKKSNEVSLLGFANWENFKNSATVTLKGTNNNNFQNKVNEFNIKIEALSDIHSMIDCI